jgi:hypothetical protein
MKLSEEGIPIYYATAIALMPALLMTAFNLFVSRGDVLTGLMVVVVLLAACFVVTLTLAIAARKSVKRAEGHSSRHSTRADSRAMPYFPNGIMPWKIFFTIFPVIAVGSVLFLGLPEMDRVRTLFVMWAAMLLSYVIMRLIVKASPDKS